MERALLKECGKDDLKAKEINLLAEIGQFVHAGGRPFVFNGGQVGTMQCESKEEENEYQSRPSRSATWTRKGQRAGPRSRASTTGNSFRSAALEAAYGAELRILVRHYKAVTFESGSGFWAVVKVKPFGVNGPQSHLLIAVPGDRLIHPKGWAFKSVGTQPRPFPLKHTNFPDASICAFDPRSGVWDAGDGLLELVDHYAIWIVEAGTESFSGGGRVDS